MRSGGRWHSQKQDSMRPSAHRPSASPNRQSSSNQHRLAASPLLHQQVKSVLTVHAERSGTPAKEKEQLNIKSHSRKCSLSVPAQLRRRTYNIRNFGVSCPTFMIYRSLQRAQPLLSLAKTARCHGEQSLRCDAMSAIGQDEHRLMTSLTSTGPYTK